MPKSFANATIVVEQVSKTEIRVLRAKVVPEDELPFGEEATSPLSDRERDYFLELLAAPPAPTPALERAATRRIKVRVRAWR